MWSFCLDVDQDVLGDNLRTVDDSIDVVGEEEHADTPTQVRWTLQ